MPRIPDKVTEALNSLTSAAVFTTVDPQGNPNSVYVAIVKNDNGETVLISDSAFSKTRANIMSGSRGAIVFLTADFHAYQLKGRVNYHTSGSLFDHYDEPPDPNHPRHGIVELLVDEVYEGTLKLL